MIKRLFLAALCCLPLGMMIEALRAEEPLDTRKLISLKSVVEEGLRENVAEEVRKHQKEVFELQWSRDYQNFWFPQIKLKLETNPHALGTLHEKRSAGINEPAAPATADGALGLELGDYTVFNWGRDYLEYQNSKESYERNLQRLKESRRQLKFNLISTYFKLIRYKKIQDFRKEQVRHTSFIYRLTKQKKSLKKASRQTLLQSKTLFIQAQNNYQEAQRETALVEEELANLLNDTAGTRYRTVEELSYVPLRTEREDAIRYAIQQSPQHRDALLRMENNQRSYEKTLKDNMPLPKFSVNFGAYRFNYGETGSYTQFETNRGHSNVELAATINLTWDILGGNGFMNSRQKRTSYLNKRISEINFQNIDREIKTRVKTLYRTVHYHETQVKLAKTYLNNTQESYDATLDNYISQKTDFPNIKFTVENLLESEINYEETKYRHLLKKLELADLMGMEDFPGENFENLAIQ